MSVELHRVVITGAGAITPQGNTPQAVVDAFRSGYTAFEPAPLLPGVAQAPAWFDVNSELCSWRHRRYLNRGAAMCVAAALQAARHAKATEFPPRCGLFIGCGPNLEPYSHAAPEADSTCSNSGPSALWILRYLPNTAASAISRLLGIHGENLTLGTACTASLQALGEAFRRIRRGEMPMALAGGGDSRLSRQGLLAYAQAGALAPCAPAPAKETEQGQHMSTPFFTTVHIQQLPAAPLACRPFDLSRQGFVAGEGAGMYVLESLDHALTRGARPLAEILGYGASMDGHAMTAPDPYGTHAETAVRTALEEADIHPEDIAAICAHGTGTSRNDEAEASMLQRLFADTTYRPPVLALKSWTGHCASACGAVELALLLACSRNGFLPPIRNLRNPLTPALALMRHVQPFIPADPPVTDHIPAPPHTPSTILLENFGFGGQNAALVVRPFSPCKSDGV